MKTKTAEIDLSTILENIKQPTSLLEIQEKGIYGVWEKAKGLVVYNHEVSFIHSNSPLWATINFIFQENKTRSYEDEYFGIRILTPNRFVEANFSKDVGFHLCAKRGDTMLKTFHDFYVEYDGTYKKEVKRPRRADIVIIPFVKELELFKVVEVVSQLKEGARVIFIDDFTKEMEQGLRASVDLHKFNVNLTVCETYAPYEDAVGFTAAGFKLITKDSKSADKLSYDILQKNYNRGYLQRGDKVVLIRKAEKGQEAKQLLWVNPGQELYFCGITKDKYGVHKKQASSQCPKDDEIERKFNAGFISKGSGRKYMFDMATDLRPAYALGANEIIGMPYETRFLMIGNLEDLPQAAKLVSMGYNVHFLINKSGYIL